MKFARFLKTTIFIIHLRWLLLKRSQKHVSLLTALKYRKPIKEQNKEIKKEQKEKSNSSLLKQKQFSNTSFMLNANS